jgi:GNAT superfamily N-acetyltransferase
MAREYKNDTLKQMTSYFTRPLTQPSDFELFASVIVALENCTFEQAKGWISSLQTQMGEALEQSIIFVAELPESKVLGAVLLRPTPNGFYELFGGVPKQLNRAELSITLLEAAQVKGGKIYTFASENYWDTTILESLGFEEVAQYQRLGNLHFNSEPVVLPSGFSISSFADNPEPADIVAGLQCYEDLWGHHPVKAEQVMGNLANYDPLNTWLVKDAQGFVAGYCSVTISGTSARVDAPAVRPDARGLGIHRALLAQAINAIPKTITDFSLESWGEGIENSSDYLQMGFVLLESEAIVVWSAPE